MQNHSLYIYDDKSNQIPKHLVCLKGLYFKLTHEKGLWGIQIFADRPSFKDRFLFHKDEGVIDQWMNYLSKHCQYYALTCLYE